MSVLDVLELLWKIATKPLQWFCALWPIKTDSTLPDLEINLWRFAFGQYDIALAARGGDYQGNVYCRVRAWILIENRRLGPITHEEWVEVNGQAEQKPIAHNCSPTAVFESEMPTPGSAALENVCWLALVSKHKEAITPMGVYRGKVRSSQSPHPGLRCRLSFLWIEFRRTIRAVVLYVVLAIALALALFLLGQSVLARLLEQLSRLWPDLDIDTSPIPSPPP